MERTWTDLELLWCWHSLFPTVTKWLHEVGSVKSFKERNQPELLLGPPGIEGGNWGCPFRHRQVNRISSKLIYWLWAHIYRSDSQQFDNALEPNLIQLSVGGFVVVLSICVSKGKFPFRGFYMRMIIKRSVLSCKQVNIYHKPINKLPESMSTLSHTESSKQTSHLRY